MAAPAEEPESAEDSGDGADGSLGSSSSSGGSEEEAAEERRGTLLACLLVAASSLLFSLMGLSVKEAREHTAATSFDLLVVRSALGLPIGAASCLIHGRARGSRAADDSLAPAPGRWAYSVWLPVRVLAGFASVLLEYAALHRLPLSTAFIILYSSPVFIVLWAAALLGQPVRAVELFFIGVCLAGLVLETRPWEGGPGEALWPYLAILASAVLAGLVMVSLRALNGVPYYVVLNLFMLGTLVLSGAFGAALGQLHLPPPRDPAWAWLTLVAACAYAAEVCITCGFARAGKHTGRVSMFKFLSPVFSMIWGAAFLGEELTWLGGAGAAMVLGSSATVVALQAAKAKQS